MPMMSVKTDTNALSSGSNNFNPTAMFTVNSNGTVINSPVLVIGRRIKRLVLSATKYKYGMNTINIKTG